MNNDKNYEHDLKTRKTAKYDFIPIIAKTMITMEVILQVLYSFSNDTTVRNLNQRKPKIKKKTRKRENHENGENIFVPTPANDTSS